MSDRWLYRVRSARFGPESDQFQVEVGLGLDGVELNGMDWRRMAVFFPSSSSRSSSPSFSSSYDDDGDGLSVCLAACLLCDDRSAPVGVSLFQVAPGGVRS